MVDIRIQRMAHILVRYSLGLKKGDRFTVWTSPAATSLVKEVVREAIRVGSHPELFVSLPGVTETIFKEASDEQLTSISPIQHLVIEEYDALLQILSIENTRGMN